MLVVGLALLVEPVPHRERHPEEALTADEPVTVEPLDPVLVAVPHVLGHPVQFAATFQQLGTQLFVAAAVADVPLAGADDLQGLVALLVEVRLALGGPGITVHLTGCRHGLHDELAGGEGRLAGNLFVGLGVDDPVRRLADDTSVASHDGASRQLQLPPPLHIGEITEGAAHGDAGALVHLGSRVGDHRHLDPVQRCGDGGAEQMLVALVVGVGDEGAAGRQELWASRLDEDVVTIVAMEGQSVIGTGVVASLQLGLGHRRLVGDVPQGRGVVEVGLTAGVIAQERQLGDALGFR